MIINKGYVGFQVKTASGVEIQVIQFEDVKKKYQVTTL